RSPRSPFRSEARRGAPSERPGGCHPMTAAAPASALRRIGESTVDDTRDDKSPTSINGRPSDFLPKMQGTLRESYRSSANLRVQGAAAVLHLVLSRFAKNLQRFWPLRSQGSTAPRTRRHP